MSNTEALKIARDALADMIRAGKQAKVDLTTGIRDGEPVHPVSAILTFPLATAINAIAAIDALAQQASAPSVEPVAWQNIQFGPEHHVPPTPAPTAQPAPSVKDSLTVQPAPLPARALTFDVISEAKQDAIEVFDAEGPETPQIVRDVIEYMASWLEVYAHKRASHAEPTGSAG